MALIFGSIMLIGRVRLGVSLPPLGLFPIIILAGACTIWGLWLGFTIHRRGEPLAVGAFGLLVTAVGLVLYAPLILLGVLILLAAAIWSAKARPTNETRS
jgi:hypothetical protein